MIRPRNHSAVLVGAIILAFVASTAHAQNLVGRWSFDGNPEGTPVAALLGGATSFVPGKVGGALRIDQQGGYATIADLFQTQVGSSTLGAGPFTISLWVNYEGQFAGHARHEHVFTSGWNGSNRAIDLFAERAGGNTFFWVNGPGTQVLNGQTAPWIASKNQWHHVAFGRDANTQYLCVDGQVVSSGPLATVFDHTNNGLSYVGQNPIDNGGRSFPGMLDELQVYDAWITAEGFDWLFSNPGAVLSPPPPSTAPACSATHSWGDVHIRTPDGLVYDFQAEGDFLFVQSNDGNVVVQARQEKFAANSRVTGNTGMAVNVNGDRVGIYAKPAALYVNGTATQLASGMTSLPNGGAVYQIGSSTWPHYVVWWPDGFAACAKVYPNSYMSIGVVKPAETQQTYEGLVGNLNGNSQDDLKVRGGSVLSPPLSFQQLYGEFGNSWCVPQAESLFDTGTGAACGAPAGPITVADLTPEQRQLGEAACGCAPEGALKDSCILDVALTGNTDIAESTCDVAEQNPTIDPLPPICGGFGDPCCANNACDAPWACDSTSQSCKCGTGGVECAGNCCAAGQVCLSGTCQEIPEPNCADIFKPDPTPRNTCGDGHATCKDARDAGYNQSGVYYVNPGTGCFLVQCDMLYDGGGWTLVGFEPAGSPALLSADKAQTGVMAQLHREAPEGVDAQQVATATAAGFIGPRFSFPVRYGEGRLNWCTSGGEFRYQKFTTTGELFANVLANQGIASATNPMIRLSNFTSNDQALNAQLDNPDDAAFCRAYAENLIPGDTSWGVKQKDETSFGCGCNGGSWTGQGSYYGGKGGGGQNVCVSWGGGWAGTAGNGVRKGGHNSNTFYFWIR